MKLFYDKDGKIKVWRIEYCPWVGKKELLDTAMCYDGDLHSSPL